MMNIFILDNYFGLGSEFTSILLFNFLVPLIELTQDFLINIIELSFTEILGTLSDSIQRHINFRMACRAFRIRLIIGRSPKNGGETILKRLFYLLRRSTPQFHDQRSAVPVPGGNASEHNYSDWRPLGLKIIWAGVLRAKLNP